MKKRKRELFKLRHFSGETIEKTLKNHQSEINEINYYYKCWDDLIDIIISFYDEDDPMYIMNIESTFSMDSSIFLASQGYYKQAISILRIWFEYSMFGIYFQDHFVEFDRWSYYEDKFRMNFSNELITYLFTFPEFEEFDKEIKKISKKKKEEFGFKSFKEWNIQLYNELSAHIHGRGYERSNLANIKFYKGEIKNYNKDYFIFWEILFNNICQVIIISFLLYEQTLMNRHKKKRKNVINCLHPDYIKILKKILDLKI